MTSKTDSPPPYEDALHHPKCGSYPLQPQQDSHVPPPSYSPNSGMCPSLPGYWGQEGVYPAAGMWAAPGFPPSGGPMTVPALSAGASNTGRLRWSSPALCYWHYLWNIWPRLFLAGEMEDFLRTQWESTSIRHSFIRKVKVSPLHVPVGLLCEFFLPLCVISKTVLRVPWAGVPHSDSTACRHHFSGRRLHLRVSVPVKHSRVLRAPEWSSPLSARAETQWGCLSSDILVSTGRLCKWIKPSEPSSVYRN